MYADAETALAKKKKIGSITCLVAAVLILASLFLPWLKAAKQVDVSMTLLSIKSCVEDRDWETDKVTKKCKSLSNFELAKEMKKLYEDSSKKPGTSFAYFGLATLIMSIIGAVALGAAGILGLKQTFIREPIAITTVALIGLCLALVLGCIFVAVKPGDSEFGRLLGVSWPFFIFGIGIVGGIAGAQMLGKAYGPPEYDPYADPTVAS